MASLSYPFAIMTSKKILLISFTKFRPNLKLQATIPPKALIGSHSRASLKALALSGFIETPHGFACLIIATPLFLGKDFVTLNAE